MQTILVTGATGSQGRPVVEKLLEAGYRVRMLARHPERAGDLTEKGAEGYAGDLGDVEAVRAAVRGVDGVFLLAPFFAGPGAALEYGRNVIAAAREAGVRLIVWNPTGEIPPVPTGNPALDLRRELLADLEASGVPYVVLQPTAYLENLLGPWTREEVAQRDTFAYPTPNEVRIQWIATADVATFAVSAFGHPDLAPLNLKVSGPERLSGEEVAERFSRALGRRVTFRPMPPREFGEKLDRVFPGRGAGVTGAYEMAYANPEMASTHVDLGAALARLPVRLTTVEEWVREHAAAFSPAIEPERVG
ncbi:SDR family oxidoreductase [Deinococcus aestuarii]|uniref:SDR family oxidoreductase n=1 Tax=Deinococcus aestuarii TaxID=2774531 RepID=UPI001C0DFA0A|nr:NmrA family NAD(P)-binding protein [Deinococcus aestuarii]